MNNRTNQTMKHDPVLTAHVTRMLDQSIEQLDPEVTKALEQRRKQALHAGRPAIPQPFLIAASLAAFLILPWLMFKSGNEAQPLSAAQPTSLSSAAEASLVTDPDFLNNWEMLDAIGEELHGT